MLESEDKTSRQITEIDNYLKPEVVKLFSSWSYYRQRQGKSTTQEEFLQFISETL